jgi:hypothetical protein
VKPPKTNERTNDGHASVTVTNCNPSIAPVFQPFLSRTGQDGLVSLSSFAYLYSELVQYHQSRVASISELERRLESSGYGVGLKVLELLAYRSKEVRIFFSFMCYTLHMGFLFHISYRLFPKKVSVKHIHTVHITNFVSDTQ